MIERAHYFFPFCFQCYAVCVLSEGPWFNSQGAELKKIAPRISACSKCLYAFYCDSNCQKKHWAEHKKTCRKVDIPVDTLVREMLLKVDTIVSCLILTEPGTATLFLDNGWNFLKCESTPKKTNHLLVNVVIDNVKAGTRTFIGCKRVNSDWKTTMAAVCSRYGVDQVSALKKSQETISRELILDKRYKEAFELMVAHTLVLPDQMNRFFEAAIEMMYAQNVERAIMLDCASVINKGLNDVNNIISKIDELPDILRDYLFFAVLMKSDINKHADKVAESVDLKSSIIMSIGLNLIEYGFIEYGFRFIGNWASDDKTKISFCTHLLSEPILQQISIEMLRNLFISNNIGDEKAWNAAKGAFIKRKQQMENE